MENYMPRGTSGRVVIEIEPKLKNQLHAMLALEGKCLKEWFVEQAIEYITFNSEHMGESLSLNNNRSKV